MDYDDNFNKAFLDHDLLETHSINSKHSKNLFQQGDTHFHTVKRNFNNICPDGKFRKVVTLKMYSTPYTGSKIRDAISGEYYKHLVGTYKQDMYFKVVMATGEFKGGPLHLYYTSPEQYERHQMCKVDERVRVKWHSKQSSE